MFVVIFEQERLPRLMMFVRLPRDIIVHAIRHEAMAVYLRWRI